MIKIDSAGFFIYLLKMVFIKLEKVQDFTKKHRRPRLWKQALRPNKKSLSDIELDTS